MDGDFRIGDWLVQPLRDVVESLDRSAPLEPKAMDLLVYLAQHQGEVIPKERLIQAVWPDAFVTDEVLTNNIWKLRQAFGDEPKNPKVIQTVPRRGYQLIAEVAWEEVSDEPVSRYEVGEKIGQGAMGEVFLAEDKQLARKVALKFILADLEQDDAAKRRLFREARAAASLDHPYICKVYDTGIMDGRTFIAMEYLEGATLKERLSEGGLPQSDALRIGREMAEALEVAHRKGIVHRDIKPSNIALTEQGHVKITDFGIAKRFQTSDGKQQEWTATLTKDASTLGTLPYMSPEQVKGQQVDPRSDIFSLGVVLYECLTGTHPFRRPTQPETITAILSEAPSFSTREAAVLPESLQSALMKMLAKESDSRFQTMSEVGVALSQPYAGPARKVTEEGKRIPRRLFVGVAGLVIVVAVISAWTFFGTTPLPKLSEFTSVPLTSYSGSEIHAALSPDGKQVAFVWKKEESDSYDLYVRLIRGGKDIALTETPEDEGYPVWSPNGQEIAFLRTSSDGNDIVTIPSLGGAERHLSRTAPMASRMIYLGLSWSPDGKWLAFTDSEAPDELPGIFLFSFETGDPDRLTTPPADYTCDSTPVFSPDGRKLAFVRNRTPQNEGNIHTLLLPAGEPKKLAHKEGDIRGLTWTADGSRICFSLDSQIQIISVSGGDTVSLGSGFSPSIRREGRALVYTRSLLMENIWRAPGPASKGGPVERFISSSEVDGMPHFSPDGERIAFISDRMGSVQVWLCNSDGTDPTQLTSLDKATSASRPRWSPDGQQILFTVWHEASGDTWVVGADGIRPHPLISGPSNDILASWSRNGRWVYFTSNRTDRQEIWKIPAAGGEAEQVTTNGGAEPFESHDERLLYYVKRLGEGRIWHVPVGGGEERQVLDARVEVLNWALWEDGICRINFDRQKGPVIEYIDFETQQVRDLARLDEKAVPNRYQGNGICVSPDGGWVLYGQNDFPFEDLMIVEDFF